MRKTIFLLLAIAVLALPAAGKKPKSVNETNENPFLTEYKTKYNIPPFDKIKYEINKEQLPHDPK